MDINLNANLNAEQRTQLELIALYAGKTPAQVVIEAARFLLEHDIDSPEWMERNSVVRSGEPFLDEHEMNVRLAEMLRR
jgi:hypothetical protein